MKEVNMVAPSEQYGIRKVATEKLTDNKPLRYAFIVLPYSLKDIAIEREIMVDYSTNHIYFKKSDGTIGSKTLELETMLQKLLGILPADDPKYGNKIPVQVEGIEASVLGEALLELLNRIQKEKEQSPYKGNVAVTTTAYLPELRAFPILDGYQTKAGDRVLVRHQTNENDNGIYEIKSDASWIKPLDYNEASDIARGMTTMVMNGTMFANHIFTLTIVNSRKQIVHVTRNIMTGPGVVVVNDVNRTIDLKKPFDGEGVQKKGTHVTLNEYGIVESIEYIKTFNVIQEGASLPNKTDTHIIAVDYTGKKVLGSSGDDNKPNFE